MTQITVHYQRNRWVEGGGSDQYAVGITFETDISADCERELAERIYRAQQFVEAAVMRKANIKEVEPNTEEMASLRRFLSQADTQEKLEKMVEFVQKKFVAKSITAGEAAIMDAEIEDAIALLAASQVTIVGGDGTEPAAEAVEKSK